MKLINNISTAKLLIILLFLSCNYTPISSATSSSNTKNNNDVSSIYSTILQMFLKSYTNTCNADSDCCNDEVCNTNTGECVQCIDNSHCGCSFQCSDFGQCEPTGSDFFCITDDDCCPDDGYICSVALGSCVPFRPDSCFGFCDTDNDCSTECECYGGECVPLFY